MEKIYQTLSNVNDNVSLTNNINVNATSKEKEVNYLVDNMMRKLDADLSSRLFYCKVAWNLPESVIYNNLEKAMTGHNPQRYFTWLCKRYL